MDRLSYLLRRLLLIIPTFLGITVLCFSLCQVVPGGPVEQKLMQMRGGVGGGESGARGPHVNAISPDQIEALKRHFGFDKPVWLRYKEWLVDKRLGLAAPSYMFPDRSAWTLISNRFSVSLWFGVTGFFLTYLVCVPLGISKALRNGGVFDVASTGLVLAAYALPAYALGMVLKTTLCGTTEGFLDWFPNAGFHSEGYEKLGPLGKFTDMARHMALPLFCYMIGGFAFLTLLMKNSLLDQIGQDYVRTVLAKGATARRAIWGHAVRNSLIPLATGIGGFLSVILASSVIIEKVFEIPGIGLLSLEAIQGRDYMVFMGILSLSTLLGLVGNVLSDFCYMLIDPRITFK